MLRWSEWLKQRSDAAAGVVRVMSAVGRSMRDCLAAAPAAAGRVSLSTHDVLDTLVVLISLGLAILFAALDLTTSPRVNFVPAYLLLVVFAGWTGRKSAGLFIASSCSIIIVLHELNLPDTATIDRVQWWNLASQVGACFVLAWFAGSTRSLAGSMARRVREATLALEHEISDRRQTEEQLVKTLQQFRQLAENITDAFWMRTVGENRVVYVSPAYESIWGRACRDLYQSPDAWLDAVHPEDRERVAASLQSAAEYNQEYRIVRSDGTFRWIRERAFPIRDGSGKVIRLVGLAEDITDRRRLERQILEISDREQARLGQDLHDGLCQKLVSVAFDNTALEQKLAARGLPEARAVEQIGAVLDDAITEARVLSRGLFPVQLETDGLGVALRQLAGTVSARAKVECRLECPEPVFVRDNAVATHLYRIAQEAVNNCLKHAKASAIVIGLRACADRIELTVRDDGEGIATGAGHGGGMGLHIMAYRARTIGGTLSVERGATGGTVVCCSAPQGSG